MERVEHVVTKLQSNLKRESYTGWDPFDGLNSALFQATPLAKNRLARLAWLQAHKRSPINFRAVCGVPKLRNPKGVALSILGHLYRFKHSNNSSSKAEHIDEATTLGDWLLANTCNEEIWGKCTWGYHFDWQARAFYVPKGTPNAITTVYICLALQELYQLTGDDRYWESIVHSAEFAIKHLYVPANTNQSAFFRYIPGESTFVHNASLWVACIVGLAAVKEGISDWLDKVQEVVMTSIEGQRIDGAWEYGSRGHHGFIDSFHTGYNLEALDRIQRQLNITDYNQSIELGFKYYKNSMFLYDGTPKYYDKQTFPIDMHTSSQALITLLRLCKSKDDYQLADSVLDWSLENMWNENTGWFTYQKEKLFDNKIPYIRWTQAWMFYSLSYYLFQRGELAQKPEIIQTPDVTIGK